MFETHWLTLSILELVRASRYDETYSGRRPFDDYATDEGDN
jgi:hypothetical protein